MTAQPRWGEGVVPGSPQRLGPYRLVSPLGEGGMGLVHLALDPSGRAVAVKVLRPHIAFDESARSRLEREVDTLALVHSLRVAAVLDADLTGDRPYLVTRYVGGPSLDDVVTDEGPLPGDGLVRLAAGLVEALDAIHGAGVVHRDLKPGNVLLEDGEPVLIDFGIAHIADDVRLTSTGMVMGTPGYLAPEVISGAAVTEATDWWGWAATLAYAATGRPPFGRGAMDVVLSRVSRGTPDLTGLDPALARVLGEALSADPRRRPSPSTVVSALEEYARRPLPEAGSRGSQASTVRLHAVPPLSSTSALPQELPGPYAEPPPEPDAGRAYADPYADPDAGRAYADESDWQAAWDGEPSQPDPRIGRPMRTGTVVALAVAATALAATWPGLALLLTVAWCWAARFSDRSVTGLVMRRYQHGHRRSDVPMAVALSPWHVLASAASTLFGLLVPAVVAVSAAFCTTLAISALTSTELSPATAPALAGGFAAGAVIAWWGPGGDALRRGSRSMIRGAVRPGLATTVIVGVLIAAAVVLAGVALTHGAATSWWPFVSLGEAVAPRS